MALQTRRLNLALHRERIRKLAIVLIAPQAAVRANVDKFCAYEQRIPALRDPPCYNRRDFQLIRRFLWVHVLRLVMENRAARAYGKIGELRKTADETFGQQAVGGIDALKMWGGK